MEEETIEKPMLRYKRREDGNMTEGLANLSDSQP